jgi:hypothetical protein
MAGLKKLDGSLSDVGSGKPPACVLSGVSARSSGSNDVKCFGASIICSYKVNVSGKRIKY